MSSTEREQLLAEQGQIEIVCEYCKERYHFDGTDLTAPSAP